MSSVIYIVRIDGTRILMTDDQVEYNNIMIASSMPIIEGQITHIESYVIDNVKISENIIDVLKDLGIWRMGEG